jgi:hypothetical protein
VKLLEALQTSLRAAKVPGQVAAKIIAFAEEALARYKITDDRELFGLPDWNLWLVLIKSLLSPLTKTLKKEGFCHANAYVIGALMTLDERAASMIREWVKTRCKAGIDPCCKNPPCCNIA